MQKLEPPQSRQSKRSLPCWHFLRMRLTGCGAGGAGGVAGTAAAASMAPKWQRFVCKVGWGAFVRSRARLRTLLDAHVCQCPPPRCSKGSAGAARLTIGGWHTGHPVGHHVKEVPKEVRPSRGEWNPQGRMGPSGENGTFGGEWDLRGRMVPLGEWDLLGENGTLGSMGPLGGEGYPWENGFAKRHVSRRPQFSTPGQSCRLAPLAQLQAATRPLRAAPSSAIIIRFELDLKHLL